MKLFLAAGGILVPAFLILWRSRKEPRWVVFTRYVMAVLVAWELFMSAVSLVTTDRINDARLRGDVDAAIADTGANAASLFMGWIPGVIYAVALGAGRAMWLRHANKSLTPS